MTHINEYALKTAGKKPHDCQAKKVFNADDVVKCIDAKGIDICFTLEAGRLYLVRDYENGGISLDCLNPDLFFDANRFQLVDGQVEPIKPTRMIPTRDPDFMANIKEAAAGILVLATAALWCMFFAGLGA